MRDTFISVTGVSKSFERAVIPSTLLQDHLLKWGKHKRIIRIDALKDVTCSVQKGEWVGIYGPNGCGKTTLLRIIAGLMDPDKGKVDTEGRMSCFFELGVGFHPERRAEENIYLHGLLQGLSPREIRAHTRRIIEFAGTESHIDLPIKCYSTGMKMRLAFAAAAQVDSDIYLFDEVLAVGDEEFQERCKDYMRYLKKIGKTILLVNHGMEQLEKHCDRVVFMDQGAVTREQTFSTPSGEVVHR